MTAKQKNIVVFYHARHWLPLRAANEAHLLCWKRYSKHRVIFINVGFGVPWYLLQYLNIDAVVFDTIFLSMHWSPEYFREHAAPCMRLNDVACPKIALPQDEFINIDIVVEFLNQIGVTHVLTCSNKSDWLRIYDKLDRHAVQMRTVLTGYVDETRINQLVNLPPSRRSIDIGYRAWNNPHWLGEHGREKVQIGEIIGAAARERGLNVDINNPASTEFLLGSDWFEFLSHCRAVLGVEGGASVLDRDGAIKCRVEAYLREHPDASFEETREYCFRDQDWSINLLCLSPRHFEACMTRTCQILLEGSYNGVFQPWRHYIPVKRDYSNLEQVFKALEDDALVDRIAEQAYQDIVASGRWSYRDFVRDIEETIVDITPAPRSSLSILDWSVYMVLRLRDFLLWRYAYFEVSKFGNAFLGIVKQPCSILARVLSRVMRMITSPGSL